MAIPPEIISGIDALPPPYPQAVNDRIARMLTTERDEYAIVVSDAMRTNPIDLGWINERNAHTCRIILLGRVKAHVRFENTGAEYLELLSKMIAAGVKVIHREALEEVNRAYMQVYPDAEGMRSRRAKSLNIWVTPFEINVPANKACTMDIPWPKEGKQVLAKINPMNDQGQAWGVGLALGWPDGQYVQINARTDGRWGIRRNEIEYLCGSYPAGKPAVIAIVLDHKRVALNAEVKNYQYVAQFPRNEFPRMPAKVRVGKIGTTWHPRGSSDTGPTDPCRVDWVKIY